MLQFICVFALHLDLDLFRQSFGEIAFEDKGNTRKKRAILYLFSGNTDYASASSAVSCQLFNKMSPVVAPVVRGS